jgi:competence protein ComEC
MFHRKFFYSLIIFLLALAVIFGGIIYYSQNSKDLKVMFLDVGQGDAILIQQGSRQMLIDGGRNGKALMEKLGKYVPFWDRQIEAIVATHPDADHIGGLVDVLKNYNVKAVIKTKAESESQTYQALAEAINKESADNIEAIKGIKVNFANNILAEVIYPSGPVETADSNASNDNSIAIILTSGENKFLLAGDLPSAQEETLNVGKIKYLKVSHHGSKYSTTDKFLDNLKPEEAVISVGKNNSYGHPAPEIIQRLLSHGIKIWRMDELGDIIYKCNPAGAGQSEKCKMEF